MADTNAHGLSRNIPADVKRTVRQACGFGCVVCGSALIEYEHVDPPFAWAREHAPGKIALLCPQCHAKVTRKFLSKAAVSAALRDPACRRTGFASEMFELGEADPVLVFAGLTLRSCPTPVQVGKFPLFRFERGEQPGAPIRFSGNFFNSDGLLSLSVEENEWMPRTLNFDVELAGGKLTIWDAPRHVSLRASFQNGGVTVEHVDMLCGPYRFKGNATNLEIVSPGGNITTMTGCVADNCQIGLMLG